MLKINKSYMGTATLTILVLGLFMQSISNCEAKRRHYHRYPGTIITPPPSNLGDEPSCNSATPETLSSLCYDFRDLRDLIPANTLVYITSKHYNSDANFRKAMDFMKTAEFASAAQQIAESDAYQQLLKEFADSGVQTASIANISSIMNCLLLPLPQYSEKQEPLYGGQGNFIVPRSLQSYAVEIMNAIPRDDFNSLVSQKLSNNTQFAQFYKIARSTGFRDEVLNGFNSYQLSYPLSVLKRNCIDLRKLARTLFKILSWGPSV